MHVHVSWRRVTEYSSIMAPRNRYAAWNEGRTAPLSGCYLLPPSLPSVRHRLPRSLPSSGPSSGSGEVPYEY